MMNLEELRLKLADPKTRREACMEMGNWLMNLCLLFGTELKTAYSVGGLMADMLEKNWGREDGS